MQLLKAIAFVGAALTTAVQAAPAPAGPPAGFSRGAWGPPGQTSAATAVPATQTQQAAQQVQTQAAAQPATAATSEPVATQEAVATAKRPQSSANASAGTPAQSTGGASPSQSTPKASPSSGSSGSSGGAGVTVVNSCSETIYVTVSQNGGNGSPQAVPKGGSPHFPLSGSDMNLKIGPQQSVFSGNIAQVEYTVGSSISWDLSLIDGNPFKAQGTSLVPSGSNLSGNCKAVHCTPGAASCPNAYNSNADNSLAVQPTLTCPVGTALTFTACSG